MKVVVHFWQLHDDDSAIRETKTWTGITRNTAASSKKFWTCWAFASDDHEFIEWMTTNCPTSSYTHRFNGGDTVFQICILEEQEAAIFYMRWCK